MKIGIIEHFPFPELLCSAFKAQLTEDYILLHLAASYVCQADIILLVVLYNCYFGILNCNLFPCVRYGCMPYAKLHISADIQRKKSDFKLHYGFRPTSHVIRAIPRHLSRSYLPVLYGSMNDIKMHNRQQKAVGAWHCDDANHDSPLACLSLPIRPHFG